MFVRPHRPRTRLVLGLALLALVANVAPVSGGLAASYQPDLRVRHPGGTLKGNNIYNGDAAGQSVTGFNARGTTRQFILTVQNDGNAADSFKIRRASHEITGVFGTTYQRLWQPPQHVTTEVGFTDLYTRQLAPGEIYYLRVYIHADTGGTYSSTLRVTSVTDPTKEDVVRYTVTVVPFDFDADEVPDASDNCPAVYNPDQADSDSDGVGDVCDLEPNNPNVP